MDINFPNSINYISKFNETRAYYEQMQNQFRIEIERNRMDADRVNIYLKNQVNKLNLLKSTGIKTSVNKYNLNMKYFGIEAKETVSITNVKVKDITIKEINSKTFDEFIRFNKKNIVQKATSMVFRTKIISDKVAEWEGQCNDVLVKNQVSILKQYDILELLYNKRVNLRELLESIANIEEKIIKEKDNIVNAVWSGASAVEAPILMIIEEYKTLISKLINEEY